MSQDLEFDDLLGALGGGWRRLLVGVAIGAMVAAVVVVAWPPRFEGRLSVLVRTAPSTSSMLRGQLGGLADLAGGSLRVGAEAGEMATEIGLLRSRALLGQVVDSLRLQVRAGRTPPVMLSAVDVPSGRFSPRGVRVEGRRLRVVDREDAIDDLDRRLTVEEAGGDLIELRLSARDSLTAAAALNLLAARYMTERRSFDRGTNQRRVDFLDRQVDSVRRALSVATATLRRVQEQSGVLAVELSGQARAQQEVALEQELATLDAEGEALDTLLAEVASRDSRRVAGFPALLRSPAVNEIVGQMAMLEVQRDTLLAELTPTAPRIRAIDDAVDGLRDQLVPLARTYAEAITRQRVILSERMQRLREGNPDVARAGEALVNAEAEVKALSTLLLGISSQRLDARLAAIGEGGVVRVVDAAVTPRRPRFPRPMPVLAVGMLVGLGLGIVSALMALSRTRPAP